MALTGDALEPAHWDAFWRFYQDTGSRKWGQPYLTRAFFDRVQATMRDDVLLVLARRARPLGRRGAELHRRATRSTAATGAAPRSTRCLHFELCYYQAIDWAIAHGLARVEAGAQGEHKLARGYLPVRDPLAALDRRPGLRPRRGAVPRGRDARAVDEEIEVLTAYGPFRRVPAAEPE